MRAAVPLLPKSVPYCDPLRLADQGWHVFPLKPGTKVPAIVGWNRLSSVPAGLDQVERWMRHFPDASWGIACGFCSVAIDNDCDTAPASALFEAVRLDTLGDTMAVRVGKPGRSVALYRPQEPIRYAALPAVGGEVYALNADLVTGRQVVAYGPHPRAPSGRYIWPVEDLHDLRPRDLPPVSVESITRFVRALSIAFVSAGLARPEALRDGRPGALDRNAAIAIRNAGRTSGGAAALAEARRLLLAAAAAQRSGAKLARHPLGLAVAVETVRAGCTPNQIADTLGGAWEELLEEAERRTRSTELFHLAQWAMRKVRAS
jgi:hypothetical protein